MPENTVVRVEAFKETVRKRIEVEIANIVENAEKEREEILDKARDRYINYSFDTIASKSKDIKTQCQRETAAAAAGATRAVFLKRTELIDGFFASVRIGLEEFVKTPRYADYIARKIEESDREKRINGEIVIYLKERDLPLIKPYTDKYKGLTAEAGGDIKIGGFILFYPREKKYLDKTLDRALEREKSLFKFKSELREDM